VGEKPEEKREAEAKNETGDDGKVKRGVFSTMNDVTRKTAQAQREFSAEVEKSAKENEETAEEEERAPDFAERIHGKDSRRNGARKERSQRRAEEGQFPIGALHVQVDYSECAMIRTESRRLCGRDGS
jgi:hypothetical protein